jgi:hypothetical protein
MPLNEAFSPINTRHLQQEIQSTANAPERGIYSSTYRVLEMPLKGTYTATHSRHWKCP